MQLHPFFKHSKKIYWSWVGLIALLTLLPGNALPQISWDFLSIDKTVHILMFTGLVFLSLTAHKYGNLRWPGNYPVAASLVTAVSYGYVLELLQSFIPQRSYDFADFTADCIGSLVGYGLFLGLSKILPSN